MQHKFVELIPDELEDGIIYVSIPYATVAHKCPSGCGKEIITPLSPTDWSLTFDGESISLSPSIGNWSLPCRSHYWIKNNQVRWSYQWSEAEIAAGRERDKRDKAEHYQRRAVTTIEQVPAIHHHGKASLWSKIKGWFS